MKAERARKITREALQSGKSYADKALRDRWDKAIRQWQSRHPAGSKYYAEAYKYRSRLFRPKTRAMVRQNEAACAAAFFSTTGLVSITANNDNDPAQLASAAVTQALIEHRLTKSVPWFLLVQGAFQTGEIHGTVISHQCWEYKASKTTEKAELTDEMGEPILGEDDEPVVYEQEITTVLCDKPKIELIPVENLLIDPAADWMDPIGTSPFVIQLLPMYVCDVKRRMGEEDDKTGQPKWKKIADGVLKSATELEFDSTKDEREAGENRYEEETPLGEYETVWVKRIVARDDAGQDWFWYAIGEDTLLTEPVEIEEAYPHLSYGERPWVWGYVALEAHRTNPQSPTEMVADLQTEINEVANSRMDNVRLALNRRRFVRRNRNVDFAALKRLIPGATVLVSDVNDDVKLEDVPDATSSSYQEHNLLALEFDDVAGSFSPSTVQANRRMNETVGGMAMLAGTASQITEYTLRVFSETWVEPVLRQVVKMEQKYETDLAVLSIAAEKAQLYQRFGVDAVTDDLLRQELTLAVNVGMTATNPQIQLQRFGMAMQTLAGMFGPEMLAQMLKAEEVIPEVFGKAGYRDGKRFFRDLAQDPRIQLLTQQVQELQQAVQGKQMEEQARNERMLGLQQMKSATDLEKVRMKVEGDLAKASLTALPGGLG